MKLVKNYIGYIVIFILNLLMFFFLHGYFNLLVMILLLLMPLVSFVAAKYVLGCVTVTFHAPKEYMHIEDYFYLQIHIDNPTVLPLITGNLKLRIGNSFYRQEGMHQLTVPVCGKGRTTVSYPLTSENLGILHMECVELLVLDWLGLFQLKKAIPSKTEIIILPHSRVTVEPDMQAVSAGMTELEESKKRGNDFSEVQDIREYQPGDKLQNIHWKMSAKKDILMVKERVSLSSSQILMFVELYQNEAMILNRILSAAYGVAVYFLENQVPFTIQWWSIKEKDVKKASIDTKGDLNSWLELLYYEEIYEDPELGRQMLTPFMNMNSKYLIVGSKAEQKGQVLFTYQEDVEGYICE